MRRLINEYSEPKVEVAFSRKLYEILTEIETYNQNNKSAVIEWKQYLEGLLHLLSYQKNALDYACKSKSFKNRKTGEDLIFVRLQDNNIGYKIEQYNEDEPLIVRVFKIELKLQDYGLVLPSWITLPQYIRECVQMQEIPKKSLIKEERTRIHITQSDICRIVESTVREYMNRQVLNENKNTCLSFVDTDGCKWDAVSSFQNGRGVGYIVEDDGCYLIYVKGKGGYWRSEYIFPEAYSALQRLPSPDTLD